MLPTTNLLEQSHRRRSNINWRYAAATTPLLPRNMPDLNVPQSNQSYRGKFLSSSKLRLAFVITVVIIIVQFSIINHYMSGSMLPIHMQPSSKADLLSRYIWFCHSFPHLEQVKILADQYQVDLVIVDPDLLAVISKDSEDKDEIEFADYRSHQGPSDQKSIIHLAALNETSGGQPNLKSFYKALENNSYTMLKYDDESQTMAHEVYTRMSQQFDDTQLDALRDLNHLEQPIDKVASQANIQISKIYTEFISHIFLLNNTAKVATPLKCQAPKKFIAIHIFVLYNWEYEPDTKWIQSSLHPTEIERHKLLAHGVHSIDFKVPLEHYYIHPKRQTVVLSDAESRIANLGAPFAQYKMLEPEDDRLLNYANNTYLHCKPSSFSISTLIDGNRKMSNYLRLLESVQTLPASGVRASFAKQLQSALHFMRVFSQTYGNFSFWLTGSSLYAYHKFCDMIVVPPKRQLHKYTGESYPDESYNGLDEMSETLVNLEIGLFADELNSTMLEDLSNAETIGVTMLSDWRKPNSHISFHIKDCPNLILNLYLYELQRDFYQYYFITRDNLTFSHKFKRKLSSDKESSTRSSVVGHHVFETRNLKLCWTRIDRLEPFKVPCDVHDHLRRIYVI